MMRESDQDIGKLGGKVLESAAFGLLFQIWNFLLSFFYQNRKIILEIFNVFK